MVIQVTLIAPVNAIAAIKNCSGIGIVIPKNLLKTGGVAAATTEPKPIAKLKNELAIACCSFGTTSGIKALYGPCAILTQASIIQIIIPAKISPATGANTIPNAFEKKLTIVPEFGNIHNAKEAKTAPPKRYGLLLPNFDVVLSLNAPIIG